MGKKDSSGGQFGLTRRDFLKVAAAGTAAVATIEPLMPAPAAALTLDPLDTTGTTTYVSTCPYCSAQCGQRVVAGKITNKVYDIYGDVDSPTNNGGLCAKGAGSLQLVNNSRRLGVPEHTAGVDGKDFTGKAWKRVGNGSWTPMTDVAAAMSEIAPKLVAARGDLYFSGDVRDLFVAPNTIGTQAYEGFGGLHTVVKADGSFFVTFTGTKPAAPALGALLLAGDPNAIMGAFDELLYTTPDPANPSLYKLVSQRAANAAGTIGAALLAQTTPAVANTADFVRVGSAYKSYVCDTNGAVHLLTSPDMVAWTYVSLLGSPTGVVDAAATTGIKSPSVITTDGTNLKVWSQRFTGAAVEDPRMFYSSFDGTAWTGPTLVTYNAVPSALPFDGHPRVSSDGTNFTMYHNSNGGVVKATAPVATPAVFIANTTVYAPVGFTEGNFGVTPNGVAYAQYAYPDPTGGLGWAYAKLQFFATSTMVNSKSVAFFGCSHINNEQNFLYRKMIANFGTSNVEHQARI